MKVKEFIEELKKFDGESKVFISSDEEMNTLFNDFEVANLDNENGKKEIVIYGLSGSEEDY